MTPAARLRDIGQTISTAMGKVDVDWTRESPAITEAFDTMQEMMARYAEETASKSEVKLAYKAWVNAHKGGLF